MVIEELMFVTTSKSPYVCWTVHKLKTHVEICGKKIDVTRGKKGLCRTSLKLSTGGEYTRLHKHGCKIPAEEKYQIKFAYKTANIVSFKHICTPSLVSIKSHFINYKSFTWLIAQDLRFRAGSNVPRALQVRQKLLRISYKLRGMNIHSQHYEAIFFRFFQTQLCWTYLRFRWVFFHFILSNEGTMKTSSKAVLTEKF